MKVLCKFWCCANVSCSKGPGRKQPGWQSDFKNLEMNPVRELLVDLGSFANVLQYLSWNYIRKEVELGPSLQKLAFFFHWGAKLRTEKLMKNGRGLYHQMEQMASALLDGFPVKTVDMRVFIWKMKYNTQPLIFFFLKAGDPGWCGSIDWAL